MTVSPVNGQTDAYIKLNDAAGKHPRIVSVTFPGDADNLDMYNSLYGHGAVIENPWVAYRVYMDNRQSLDLYVKKSPRLELEETGFYTTPGQLDDGYGSDVLWAGKSIAAGSFRGWQSGVPVTIDTVATRTQTVVAPYCVEVKDSGWIFNGHPIEMTQKYTVCSDSRDLWVEITLDGHLDTDLFCVGVQKLETDNEGFIDPKGLAASWGANVPDKARPEIVEKVGLAIVVDRRNIVDAREDALNYMFIVRPGTDNRIRYRVISCGDREEGGFSSASEWFGYVRNFNFFAAL